MSHGVTKGMEYAEKSIREDKIRKWKICNWNLKRRGERKQGKSSILKENSWELLKTDERHITKPWKSWAA